MSKNELLERMKGANGGASRGAGARAGDAPDDNTTRVSQRVVRRRPASEKADSAPEVAPPLAAAAAAPEPASAGSSVRRRPAADRVDAAPEPPPERAARAAEPEPAAAPVPATRAAPEPAPVVEAAPAAQSAPAAPTAPASAEPPAASPPVAARRAEPAEPAPNSSSSRPAAPPIGPPSASPPASQSSPASPASTGRPALVAPDGPRFVGLGSAVVRPPPGYDPANPTAWRRRVEAEAQQAAPEPESSASRRRRVASGGAGRPGRGGGAGVAPIDTGRPGQLRGRANPAASLPNDMLRKRRRPLKKKLGGSSTAAMKAEKRKVRIDNVISVGQLAHEMGLKATVVIRTLMELGTMVTVNEMLDLDTATLVANEFDYEVENVGFQEDKLLQHFSVDEDEGGESRPPVVTIMGHVDHGKTTLLDTIRKAKVAAGEAGGITQHIGAYQVERDGHLVTFLDTPGHAAFSAMRARGAQVTDIVILVVAADDGVQPQTLEAISHAKAAGVPIIVAVNKMDKAGVSAEPIMQALSLHGLLSEQWGGDTQFVPVSALKGQGIDDLISSILVQNELLELVAPIDRPAEGIVIEAKVERGRGPVASVLIQRGTLNQGDTVVLGSAFGKVRAMVDHRGKRIKTAGPSTPVEIFGISDVPSVGDIVTVVKSEKDARAVAEHRAEQKREAQFRHHSRRNIDDLFAAASAAQSETLYIVLKADVQGSVEALRGALEAIQVGGSDLRILHAGVGNVSESDVNLVVANRGLLLGFNVKVDANARKVAEEHGVQPELFSVIYDILDRVEGAMKGLIAPEYEEVRKGSAEVRATFKISRIGTVAGCYVLDGKIGRNHKARVLRAGREVWSGAVSTLKRFKDDVREVASGYECGIVLDGFHEFADGDVIETYAMEQVAAS
jgi:translation initiation factor IF-2